MSNELVKGLVIKAVAGKFEVLYNNEVIVCSASTKLKLNKNQIITGDYVEFNYNESYIYKICEREHELIRPKLANVNKIMLIFSATEPKINYGLLDRMLLIMEQNKLQTSIVITKNDLLSTDDRLHLEETLKYYEQIGYEVFYSDRDFDKIKQHLQADKFVFTGQSGVGKSTLINKLIPDLNLKTNEISMALGRGKHTTREVTFYPFQSGFIIDTPGFSALDIDLTIEEVRDNYIDFRELSVNCKFNNCYHLNEPSCMVKENLNNNSAYDLRYDNYVKLINDIKEKK